MIDVESERIATFAKRYGMQRQESLLHYPLIEQRQQKIPYAFAREKALIPVAIEDGCYLIAMASPLDLEALELASGLLGSGTRQLFASKEAIEEAIELCYKDRLQGSVEIAGAQKGKKDLLEADDGSFDLLDDSSDSFVVKLLNALFKEAIEQGASDIHFDPKEDGLAIRFRIDGILQQRLSPPKEWVSQLLTRIKVLAHLDIAEQRLPQDGRIKVRLAARTVDMRVSTIPCVFGERIVLRLLDKTALALGLGKIGLSDDLLKRFSTLIRRTEGIVLVTGPTGSGKTTTLYSALTEVCSDKINIMTIEDPVEYKLQNMAQMSVNPKISLTFATGLRHILRQDPDVIMIGEIRDKETAEIAIQAALTGHLVLSTLHTNDAPSALTRLIDMGIEPYLLTSSVVGVMAQRLVRTVCPSCKAGSIPSERELKALGLNRTDLKEGMIFRGTGCSYCYGSGYKGRKGIYELMVMSAGIKRQLLSSADAHALRDIALNEGLKTLRQEGARLVAEGLTTPEELARATQSGGDLG
jgi:general secretion pathway protein E